MKQLNCVNPPSSEFIRNTLCELIEGNDQYENAEQAKQWKRLAKFMRKNVPDKEWLLRFLATLMPNHEVFQRGYRAPVKQVR